MDTNHNTGRQNSNTTDSSTEGTSGGSSEGHSSTGPRVETAEREPAVFVSGVIGSGADAHRLVKVERWEFKVPGESGTEPMIPDTDLAERLGLPLHKLRQLSGRHERAGNIAPEVSTTVVETSRGGRPGVRRLYNEADALFLATRSETDQAIELVKEMIRVYMLARRGLLPGQSGITLNDVRAVCIEMIRAEMATTRAEVSEIRSLLKVTAEGLSTLTTALAADRAHGDKRLNWIERTLSQSGMVDGRFGPRHAKIIKDALKDCAASVHPKKTEAKAYAKLRSTMEKDLRLAIGIKQIAWTEVPASPENLAAAYSGLDRLRAQARALRVANEKQQELFKKN